MAVRKVRPKVTKGSVVTFTPPLTLNDGTEHSRFEYIKGIMFHRVKTKPRNFTCVFTMDDLPDGQLFWVIKNGSPGTDMPSFNYLEDEQVWQLILYLRSFSKEQ